MLLPFLDAGLKLHVSTRLYASTQENHVYIYAKYVHYFFNSNSTRHLILKFLNTSD